VWDPAIDGIYQDGVNRDLPGSVVDDTSIVVESIDHAGGMVDNQTYETNTTYDLALGGQHDFAKVTLPAGFYRVYPEGSPETGYVIVVGDPDELVAAIEDDLRDQQGQLTEQAREIREYKTNGVLRQYTVTTDNQGEWSVDVPASVTRVSVQAHSAPPGLKQDPRNVSLQDVREYYEISKYNGSFVMPAEMRSYDVPTSNITVDVVETQAPQFADLGRFKNGTAAFEALLRNTSYSELPAQLQQQLKTLDREQLEETNEKLQRLTNENARLEQRVEELLDRDPEAIEINDSSDAELMAQIQAQQQAITELRSTIETAETDTEVSDDFASSTATFAQELTREHVRVIANFQNGTSREVPNQYVTLDQSAGTIVGEGGTEIVVEDYPIGDAAGVTFDYIVVSENGIGKTSTTALKPGSNSIGLDAISLTTLRPGPDELVGITLIGDDETQVTDITSARAVAPDGTELNTTVEDSRTARFTTHGAGTHYVEITFETASGKQGTLTHRIAAGDADQAMPPGIRLKNTPFGTVAVVGDGFKTGSVDVRNGGTSIDVTAQVSANDDAPAQTHLYAHGMNLPPTSTLSMNIVRGEEQRAVQRHVEVTAHLPVIASGNAVLYRGEDALPRSGEGDLASVSTSGDETTIVTVTNSRGSLQLKTNNNPGLDERIGWWIDRNTPEFSLGLIGQLRPPLTRPLDLNGVIGWVRPKQASTQTPTGCSPTLSAVLA